MMEDVPAEASVTAVKIHRVLQQCHPLPAHKELIVENGEWKMKTNMVWKTRLLERLLQFSINIIWLTNKLPKSAAGFVISGQLIRSGTSIGANMEEAQDASSLKDFIQKLTIALREAKETLYWLKIIKGANLLADINIDIIYKECEEIISILVTSIKSAKKKIA